MSKEILTPEEKDAMYELVNRVAKEALAQEQTAYKAARAAPIKIFELLWPMVKASYNDGAVDYCRSSAALDSKDWTDKIEKYLTSQLNQLKNK